MKDRKLAVEMRLARIVMFTVVVVAALVVPACAPHGREESQDSAADATTATITWSFDSDCTQCHSSECSTDNALMAVHTKQGSECQSCHTDEDALSAAHEGATEAPDTTQLRSIKKNMGSLAETCLSCHGSYEELAKRTTECTAVVDSAGTVINPHALPSTKTHESEDVGECTNCHVVHGSSGDATDSCFKCHHTGTFSCGSCHEPM